MLPFPAFPASPGIPRAMFSKRRMGDSTGPTSAAICPIPRSMISSSIPTCPTRCSRLPTLAYSLPSTAVRHAEDVLRDADTAMYRAKAIREGQHQVFDKSMHEQAVRLLKLETDLRRTIERKELRLHYQPIMSLHTEL